MPQVFKIAGYTVYFWVNENDPLEPVHVHIAKGVPSPNATKIWITKNGKCLLCNNNSKIPDKQLRVFMQIIEARSKSVLDLWYSTFKPISFYCSKVKDRPCANRNGLLHRFSLAGHPERYNQSQHLNYIISRTSAQGASFLYSFLPSKPEIYNCDIANERRMIYGTVKNTETRFNMAIQF